MKKITIKSKTEEDLVKGAVAKISTILDDYMHECIENETFDENFSIKVFNKDNPQRSIILRIGRGLSSFEYPVNFFVHICIANEAEGEQFLNTMDIIRYQFGNTKYLLEQIHKALSFYLRSKSIEFAIELQHNEKNAGSIKYVVRDNQLSSKEKFIDDVIMTAIDDYLGDNNPMMCVFFEYELHNGVTSKVGDKDDIFMNIYKLPDGGWLISGCMPSSRSDSGRDYSSYYSDYANLKKILSMYLKSVFALKDAMFFDETMKVSVLFRSIEQYQIVY